MDPATILVMVLCAGAGALLVWFEVNSRRNEAGKKQRSTPDQAGLAPMEKQGQIKVEPGTRNKKAA